jgi:ATP-dependent exoDNAse (exonuclease V) alpha subunit
MTAIDNLKVNVVTLTGKVGDLANAVVANDAAIQKEIEALTAALSTGDTTAVQTAADNIATLSEAVGTQAQAVAAETAKLAASLPVGP